MSWNNIIGYIQLLASPVFTIVLTVVTIVVAVFLIRFLRAAQRLSTARRKILEVELAELNAEGRFGRSRRNRAKNSSENAGDDAAETPAAGRSTGGASDELAE